MRCPESRMVLVAKCRSGGGSTHERLEMKNA